MYNATPGETSLFMSSLKPDDSVLEYGSGRSTLEIAKIVRKIVSIEHQKQWYKHVSSASLDIGLDNCCVFLSEPTSDFTEGGDDGTYEQFKDYIEYPLDYAPFDVILIDGRARVECAKICNRLVSSKDSTVFVHDIVREEYKPIFDILEHIETVDMMAKFKIREV